MTTPTRPDARRIAVVGGGMLGATVALRFAQSGATVTVFEAGATLGGLAAPWTIDTPRGPLVWDRHYHVTLGSDGALRSLLGELDLDDAIHWAPTRTGIFADGRLAPVSGPLDFVRLRGLSPVAKARLVATLARGATTRNWQALETMTAEQWLTRWSGRRTFERFWVPLLAAKLGDGWPDANAAFIWATIQRLTAARRAGIGDEQFGSVPGGYAAVVGALSDRLTGAGATITVGHPVEAVVRRGDEVVVRADATDHHFDDVVITASPRVAAGIVDGLEPAQQEAFTRIRYQGVVCASLVLERPLSPYYLTYLLDDLPFTGLVEMTTLIPPAWVHGYHLVYLPRYVASDSPWFDEDDEVVRDRFLAGLRRVHPIAATAECPMVAFQVSRAREVFPLPVLRFSESTPDFATSVPGVWMVNSSQIVNGTLNVNETVGLADRAVEVIRPQLAPVARAPR